MNDSELELYSIVGKMFREIREEKNLSLTVVSEYLQIAPISLQRYECGERKIKIGTIKKLCEFYKINFDDFIIEAKLRFGKNIYPPDTHQKNETFNIVQDNKQKQSPHIQTLLDKTENLNTDGLNELNTYADYLLSQEKYRKIKVQEKII